jgi:FlaA1/EpsC-like NDP-sugar epimerase
MTVDKKTALITGGSGFLGRHLGLRFQDQYRVVLASRDAGKLAEAGRATGCATLALDVTHIDSVRTAIAEVAPHVIVHAAANKFVDAGEREPFHCIDANVLGSQNVARVAMERGVAIVVGVSSDSAAPPAQSTYGLTKAILERLFCSLGARAGTRFTSVRLGNLAWSTGSVFPAWQAMAARGKIESTGPDDQRFFLSGDEASRVVATAIAHIDELSGKVLVPRMKAARIGDLLDAWVRKRGGAWAPSAKPRHDRLDDRLIGDLELPHTQERAYDGAPYYVISFNEKAATPLSEGVTTANAARFDERELLALITPPTSPELR